MTQHRADLDRCGVVIPTSSTAGVADSGAGFSSPSYQARRIRHQALARSAQAAGNCLTRVNLTATVP
jgi:hypothetical protein